MPWDKKWDFEAKFACRVFCVFIFLFTTAVCASRFGFDIPKFPAAIHEVSQGNEFRR